MWQAEASIAKMNTFVLFWHGNRVMLTPGDMTTEITGVTCHQEMQQLHELLTSSGYLCICDMIRRLVCSCYSQHFFRETRQLTILSVQNHFQLFNVENSWVTWPASNPGIQIAQSLIVLFVHFPIERKIQNWKKWCVISSFYFGCANKYWQKQTAPSFFGYGFTYQITNAWMIHRLSVSASGCSPVEIIAACCVRCMDVVTHFHKRAAETSGISSGRATMTVPALTLIPQLWVSPPFWSYSRYCVSILKWETRVFQIRDDLSVPVCYYCVFFLFVQVLEMFILAKMRSLWQFMGLTLLQYWRHTA